MVGCPQSSPTHLHSSRDDYFLEQRDKGSPSYGPVPGAVAGEDLFRGGMGEECTRLE